MSKYVNIAKVNNLRISLYDELVSKEKLTEEQQATLQTLVRDQLVRLYIPGLDCENKAKEIVQDAIYMVYGKCSPCRENYPIPLRKVINQNLWQEENG